MTMMIDKSVLSRIAKATTGLIALTVGGLIYIRYRCESLLMFDGFQDLNISDFIASIRNNAEESNVQRWVVYNMPAGLWLFAYLLIIDAIWGKDQNSLYMCYLYILPILAIVSELMQYFGFLPGTFDFFDLLSYISAILLFIIIKKM